MRPRRPASLAAAGDARAQQQLRATMQVRAASDAAATAEAVEANTAAVTDTVNQIGRSLDELRGRVEQLEP